MKKDNWKEEIENKELELDEALTDLTLWSSETDSNDVWGLIEKYAELKCKKEIDKAEERGLSRGEDLGYRTGYVNSHKQTIKEVKELVRYSWDKSVDNNTVWDLGDVEEILNKLLK